MVRVAPRSTSIALRLNVTPLVIGLAILAFGTGSPELFVSVEAAYRGNSGIGPWQRRRLKHRNIALILGMWSLVRLMRVHSKLIRREIPLMIAVTLILCVLLFDGVLNACTSFFVRRFFVTVGKQELVNPTPEREVARWNRAGGTTFLKKLGTSLFEQALSRNVTRCGLSRSGW